MRCQRSPLCPHAATLRVFVLFLSGRWFAERLCLLHAHRLRERMEREAHVDKVEARVLVAARRAA